MSSFTDSFSSDALAESIWGEADLPDARLHSRLRTTVSMLIERLDAPAARVPRKTLVGAQRFWNNPRVNPRSLMDPMLAHQATLVAKCAALIVSHDTMEIDLTGRHQPEDAGPLRSSNACGYLMHWALAVDPDTRRPLAALACNVWTRPMQTRKKDHASRPPEQRESIKWKREIKAALKVLRAAGNTARVTHVLDREGDTHDNFTFARAGKHRIITRAAHDHAIQGPSGTLFKLLSQPAAWSQEAHITREVPTKASEGALREARQRGRAELESVRKALKAMGGHRPVQLRVRWACVTLAPDQHLKKSSRRASVKVWVVHVEEQGAPELVEPLSWVLLTTVPVANESDALWVLDGYRSRWPIEPMHAVLKTGLHAEQQSVDSVASMQRLLAVLLPVSLHLMRWAYGWRSAPQALASDLVPAEVIDALKSASKYRALPLPRRPWTLKDFVLRLAALGGYESRKDSSPGWLVLWRGWQELLRFWRVVQFARGAASDDLPDKSPPNPSWKPRGL